MKGGTLKRIGFGVFVAITVVVAASGCTVASTEGAEQGKPAEGQGSSQSEEQQVAEERAAMKPEDYTNRILNVEDVPGDFTLDEEIQFGESTEDDGNVFSDDGPSSEEAQSILSCMSDGVVDVGNQVDGVSAMRTFSATFDSSFAMILSSLSRPEEDPKTLVSAIRSDLEKCSSIEPATRFGEPVESMEIFEPTNARGDGVCVVAFDGQFESSNTYVSTHCVIAWDGELLMIQNGAAKQGPSSSVDSAAVEGSKSQLTDDLLPIALKKAGFSAS